MRERGKEAERNQVPRENKGQRSEGQAETGRQTAGTAMDRRQFENWSTKLINITHTYTYTLTQSSRQAGSTKTAIEHIERGL